MSTDEPVIVRRCAQCDAAKDARAPLKARSYCESCECDTATRDVGRPTEPIAPGSAVSFAVQREEYLAARARARGRQVSA